MLNQAPKSRYEPNISLTLATAKADNPDGTVRISTSRLLTYHQQTGLTRLKLTGGATIEVKESTDQIDRLVRAAATQGNPALQ